MNSVSTSIPLFKLSDALPQTFKDKNIKFKEKISNYSLLLNALQGYCTSLRKMTLEDFDGLVGENACQIRAIRIALTAQQCLENVNEIEKQIVTAKNKLANIVNKPFYEKKIKSDSFFNVNFQDIELTQNEFFIFLSYILTTAKLVKPPKKETPLLSNESSVPNLLRKFEPNVTARFLESLVKHLKKQCSYLSVCYILERALALGQKKEYSEVCLKEMHIINELKQHSLPSYWSFIVCLTMGIQYDIPLVLHTSQRASENNKTIREASFFYEPIIEDGKKVYRSRKVFAEDLQKNAFRLEGVTYRPESELSDEKTWCNQLLEHNIIDLTLANAVSHRQYPDSYTTVNRDQFLENLKNENYQYYHIKADEWGCSLRNPSLLFLNHIFCTKVGYSTLLKNEARVSEIEKISNLTPFVGIIGSYLEN